MSFRVASIRCRLGQGFRLVYSVMWYTSLDIIIELHRAWTFVWFILAAVVVNIIKNLSFSLLRLFDHYFCYCHRLSAGFHACARVSVLLLIRSFQPRPGSHCSQTLVIDTFELFLFLFNKNVDKFQIIMLNSISLDIRSQYKYWYKLVTVLASCFLFPLQLNTGEEVNLCMGK